VGGASFTEGQAGIGVAWEGRLGELRARVALIPTAVVTAVGDDAITTTVTTPGMLVPLELGLPLGGGVSFGAVIEPGIAAPVRVVVDNRIETGRDRLFVNVGASLTFGGPFD
jgi:riboflavin biosynthesis pyrimidine reductase